MKVEYLNHWSSRLGRQMRLNRYGHGGMPFVVFPSSGGSHNEYADFGMIDASREYIERGLVQFFTLSSIDSESWLSFYKSMHDRARAHEAYDSYVIDEAIPYIKHMTGWRGALGVTGCSMGAYHSVNFYLRHPDVFQRVIALSGIYDAHYFGGDYGGDPLVFKNSPSEAIWFQDDGWFIDHYRRAKVIICTGQGPWEQDGLASFYELKKAFELKNLPGSFELWGHDVAHDWPWWRKQMPYFLSWLFK